MSFDLMRTLPSRPWKHSMCAASHRLVVGQGANDITISLQSTACNTFRTLGSCWTIMSEVVCFISPHWQGMMLMIYYACMANLSMD